MINIELIRMSYGEEVGPYKRILLPTPFVIFIYVVYENLYIESLLYVYCFFTFVFYLFVMYSK